jgi:hypothetical protein
VDEDFSNQHRPPNQQSSSFSDLKINGLLDKKRNFDGDGPALRGAAQTASADRR